MKSATGEKRAAGYPLFRRLSTLVRADLQEIYARDLRKWLLIAPAVGVVTGLVVTGIAIVILREMWPAVLGYYLKHWWAIVPGLVLGCGVAGALMQYFTADPDEHSTEEVIRSYHDHHGRIDGRWFVPKILAAIATVGMGGSAALEGPSIYGGGAIGSWMWKHFAVREGSRRAAMLRKLKLDERERRILLICGAAAGMSAVFRAPLTGIVFALEMPYRDDLAHEALVPSLLASVVAFVTLGAFLGTAPLFDFQGSTAFTRTDVYWSALLGLLIGLIAVVFTMMFRRARRLWIDWSWPHWIKLAIGGLLTGLCGVGFLMLYPGNLTPLGPNYEAVDMILNSHHGSLQLVIFAVFKLAATLFTLAAGGVSAMFVPLFLTGGSLGTAFAQSIAHSSATGLFAAVGMASFLSAGYKTPLAAVVFVAEATGGHAFIVPALIGAAVAYAVSGDASASGEQRLHEGERVREFEA